MRSASDCNDLADFGNKYLQLKDRQLNILMAYDIKIGRPLLSRIYDGGEIDKSRIRDILDRFDFHDTLFIVDRGFYSAKNIDDFSSNMNHYIIPLAQNLKVYKETTAAFEFPSRFVYERSKKKSVIEYKDVQLADSARRIIVLRDINENAVECENYMKHLSQGRKGFSNCEHMFFFVYLN